MSPVELVVTDLDGTFWHTDDHIAPSTVAAVAELERRGVAFLVATGRRLASTRAPLARVGLTPPAVLLNGALGVDLATGERFHRAPYPTEQALAVLDAFAGGGLSPVVYVDDERYDVLLSRAPDTNPGHVRDLGDTAGRVDDLRAAVERTPVLGFSMIGVPFAAAEAADAALQGLAEAHLDRSIDYPGLASFTAAPQGQSKWDGVLAFCAARHLDATRVLAVADGPNDLELLDHAAIRAVPKVAHPDALARATAVIPSAQDAGWADILALLD